MKTAFSAFALVLVPVLSGCSREARHITHGSQTERSPKVVEKASPKGVSMTQLDMSSPQSTWVSLLKAMRDGDEKTIARLTTAQGLASLESAAHSNEKLLTTFQRLGKGWTKWAVRWHKRTDSQAEAFLGPEEKRHGLTFKKTLDGWKLHKWSPGD